MPNNDKNIAIIGMACRFPGARDYFAFWNNLIKGVNSIREIPPERWDIHKYYSPKFDEPNKSISKWCGLLDNIDLFDNQFFSISPREAKNMDPQQRLLLEETWHCIEDAGVSLSALQEKKTSVYVGVMANDYQSRVMSYDKEIDSYAAVGNYESILANRISYTFGFNGPSLSINAACAASMVALHNARMILLSGESDYAIAAGVNLNISPQKYIAFSKSRMLSADGQCKTFDKEANGYVPGDGVGVLLLQPLKDALKDNCHIYGLLKGTAINHVGHTASITAPSVKAQKQVVLDTYRQAGVNPETVTYIEAHGTGTSLGDPIEIEALTRAFKEYTDKTQFCRIGSVKTNIGHLEGAAGMAGVIKVLLMMGRKKIPPTLNINTFNPVIDFDHSPFVVATDAEAWVGHDNTDILRAGVSAFGFGGANGHAVLESFEDVRRYETEEKAVTNEKHPFIVTAKSMDAFKNTLEGWQEFVNTDLYTQFTLKDICATNLTARGHHAYGFGCLVDSKDGLRKILENPISPDLQKPQYPWCMAIGDVIWEGANQVEALLKEIPLCKKQLDSLLQILTAMDTGEEKHTGKEAKQGFFQSNWPASLQSRYSLIVNYTILSTIMALGGKPDLITGINGGLWTALALSGVIEIKDALYAVSGMKKTEDIPFLRPSIPFYDLSGQLIITPYHMDGAYLSHLLDNIRISDKELRRMIEKARTLYAHQYTFKKLNEEWDPHLQKSLKKTLREMLFDGQMIADTSGQYKNHKVLLALILEVSHCRINRKWDLSEAKRITDPNFNELAALVLDDVMSKAELVDLLIGKKSNRDDIGLTVNGRQVHLDENKPYALLKEHSRKFPVIKNAEEWFSKNVEISLPSFQAYNLFLLGPIPQLDILREEDSDRNVMAISPKDIAASGIKEILRQLWLKGVDIQWHNFYAEGTFKKVPLPTYGFSGQSFWLNSVTDHKFTGDNSAESLFFRELDPEKDQIIKDTMVDRYFIMPSPLRIEMAFQGGRKSYSPRTNTLLDLRFPDPAIILGKTKIELSISNDTGHFDIKKDEKRICSGKFSVEDPAGMTGAIALEELTRGTITCHDAVYALFQEFGYLFGPGMKLIDKIWETQDAFLIKIVPKPNGEGRETQLDPFVLDGIFQSVFYAGHAIGNLLENQFLYVPFTIKALYVLGPLTAVCYAVISKKHLRILENKDMVLDIDVYDEKGENKVSRIDGIHFRRVPRSFIREYLSKDRIGLKGAIHGNGSALRFFNKVISAPNLYIEENIEKMKGIEQGMAVLEEYGRLLLFYTLFHNQGRTRPEEIIAKDEIKFIEKYNRLRDSLYQMFADNGMIKVENEHIQISKAFIREGDLSQSIESLKRRLRGAYGNTIKSFQVLLEAAIAQYPDVISGRKSHMDALFPKGEIRLFEHVYKNNPLADYYNHQVRIIIESILEAKRSRGDDGQIKILEVGAGIGGTSMIVLEGIEKYGDHIEYVYSDISVGFINFGKKIYGKQYPFLKFQTFDMEREGIEQKFKAQDFDIVVATNAIHATKNLEATLLRLRRLLKQPDGILVLNEITQLQDYWTIVVGLTDGWWLYQDDDRRINNSPLANISTWKTLLSQSGFQAAAVDATRKKEYAQTVMVALNRSAQETIGQGPLMQDVKGQKPAASAAKVQDSDPGVSSKKGGINDLSVQTAFWLKEIFANVLQCHRDDIDDDGSFSEDYGVDSFVIMEIMDILKGEFGEDIPATLLFEYTTMGKLTAFFVKHFEKRLQARFCGGGEKIKKEKTSLHQNTPPVKDSARDGKRNADEDIAIIGLSGRFPMSEDVSELWEHLIKGDSCIREVPQERWDYRAYYDETGRIPGKGYTKYGGFLDDYDKFDSLFFNIAPRHAELMDPQQRIVLETAWGAIEDAGYSRYKLPRNTGVFIGVTTNTYGLCAMEASFKERDAAAANCPDTDHYDVANRVSYFFDFHGPSMAVDTACSSSLTAIHLAVRSLRQKESELAIAGGVNLTLHPHRIVQFCQKNMLSSGKECRPFGDGQNGFVDGEGVSLVLLKPLSKAMADRDHIYGVIKGTAVNSGGKTSGYTVPNPARQAQLVIDALEDAQINPGTISYVETHGTGTKLGDPIEVEGLTRAFRKYTEKVQFCPIGSIKSNIGHLIAAAGIAGVVKVLLQMKYNMLVPSIHSLPPNPHIDYKNTPFGVQQDLIKWKKPEVDGISYPRRAGVSSFGAGGANAHVIVEQFSNPPHGTKNLSESAYIFVLSAKDNERLGQYVKRFIRFLDTKAIEPATAIETATIEDMAYTLQTGREAMEARLAMVVSSYEDAKEKLTAYVKGAKHIDGFFAGNVKANNTHKHLSAKEDLRDLIKNKHFGRLAQLWVSGVEIDWDLLYETRTPKRISLPTYPFRRDRYWIPETASPVLSSHLPFKQFVPHAQNDQLGNKKNIHNNGSRNEPLAIIGMAGILPQAKNLDQFWDNLVNARECITEIPADRWDWKLYYGDPAREDGKINIKWGGFIDDMDKFDPQFFSISPREAELMDPQQRIFLQCVWQTIEQAGYNPKSLKGTRTGVFVGIELQDYAELLAQNNIPTEGYTTTGTLASISANRISYLLDFHGPSQPISTACSSSLISIHRAVQAIRSGDCSQAVAGGVNAILSPKFHIGFGKAGMLSEDGRCKTFSDKANGYVRGEGVGAIMLKPLSQAENDGDTIYAVIRASAENHGGRANNLTAPNPKAQAELLKGIYEAADISPDTVGYIEAHGTGTALGDPIEINGLKMAFKALYEKYGLDLPETPHCGIGSVKSNIGHLETAAGIASVLKVILALKHKTIPATLNCETISPYIDLRKTPFYIAHQSQEWMAVKDGNGNWLPRRAGVSSYGLGGVNAHIVLEEYGETKRQCDVNPFPEGVIPLSAKSQTQLKAYALRLFQELNQKNDKNFSDIAYTLQVGREAMNSRIAFLAKDNDELIEKLNQYINGETNISGFWSGAVKGGQDEISVFTADDDIQEAIDRWIDKGKIRKLAELWVRGLSIDWHLLYGREKPKRISLPTYPFEKQRCWIPANRQNLKNETGYRQIHPLVHENTSTLHLQQFTSIFSGEEFFFKDHQVLNEKVLPGAAYLEMVLTAAQKAMGSDTEIRKLKNIVWAGPIKVNGEKQTVAINLYPETDHIVYEVITSQAKTDLEKNSTIHSQGKISLRHDHTVLPVQDIDAIKNRCSARMTSQACYQIFQNMGLHYGPSFQRISEIYYNNREVLAKIEISGLTESDTLYSLHPGVLDSALQTCLILEFNDLKEITAPYVPFALKELDVIKKLPLQSDIFVHATRNGNSRTASETLKFDVALISSKGEPLAILKELATRQIRLNPLDQSKKHPLSIEENKVLCAGVHWQDQGITEAGLQQNGDMHIFLMDQNEGLESQLKEMLAPKTQISFSTQNSPDDIIEAFKVCFSQIKSIMETKPSHPQTIIVFTSSRVPEYVYAPIGGLLKSSRREHTKIRCKIIQLPETAAEKIKKIIAQEMQVPEEIEVRYLEEGQRQVKKIVEIDPLPSVPTLSVAPGGVYWITGGMGGLGRIFAQKFVMTKGSTIVLSNRKELDEKSQRELEELQEKAKEHQSTVAYLKCDVSDPDAVASAVKTIRKRHHKISGVIHSAGLNRDNYIYNKTESEIDAVMAPKIHGAWNLCQTLPMDEIDFLVFFSSIVAVKGNPGQADYAGANAFLDAYAGAKYPGKIISINWPLWKKGGMKVDAHTEEMMKHVFGMETLSTASGYDGFQLALAALKASCCQILVAEGRSSVLRSKLWDSPSQKFEILSDGEPTYGRGEDGLKEKFIAELLAVVGRLLKINPQRLDIFDDISDYGFDSILLTEFINTLNELFDLDLLPTLFFEYKTLDALITYFITEHGAQLKKKYGLDHDEKKPVAPPLAKSPLAPSIAPVIPKHRRFIAPLQSKESVLKEPVAIIGMAGILPAAENLDQFWENLMQEKDCISEIPKDRWDWQSCYGDPKKECHKTNIKWGGFIGDVDKFDPSFFNISPREAEFMDPQQRLFLQCVWHAIEQAGYNPVGLRGSRTGLFVGVEAQDYQDLLTQNRIDTGAYAATGIAPSMVANRVSFLLDFHGPSEPVSTACSSSLIAIHRAVRSIRQGECDQAIAGGVNVILAPKHHVGFSKAGMLSQEGRCKPFSDRANGYVRGEGVGAIMLKPLSLAKRDKDTIYAVIKESGTNHGGHVNSLTAPNPTAQADLIKSVYKEAEISPDTITYIEAHGTGTALGDPVEINALITAFKALYHTHQLKEADRPFCGIGSVKSNIGHLETAAGIASILKVVLALRHKILPPTLHCETINPYIDLKGTPFYIARQKIEWLSLKDSQGDAIPRRAGISSFGFGGANAHVVLEEYPLEEYQKEEALNQQASEGITTRAKILVPLSAKNKVQLKIYAVLLLEYLKCNRDKDVADIAYTLQVGREAMNSRIAVMAHDVETLIKKLEQYKDGNTHKDDNVHRDGNVHIEDFWQGEAKFGQDSVISLTMDEDAREMIRKWIEKDKINKLADFWVKGLNLDWNLLYGDAMPCRIALPTYPFEKKRYWFDSYAKSQKIMEMGNKDASSIAHQDLFDAKVKGLPEIVTRPDKYRGDEVSIQVVDKHIGLVVMQDREGTNTFTENLVYGLQQAFAEMNRSKEIKVIVLTGYDKVFAMGGDQKELTKLARQNIQFENFKFLYQGLLETRVPVVVAMQGHATGGGLVFGLYGDIIIMARQAVYSANFMGYGFTPGLGATYILEQRFGKSLATEMMFTSKAYKGENLERRGGTILFHDQDKVLDEALLMAQNLLDKPLTSLQVLKKELSGRILEQLRSVIDRETVMHQQTFSLPEVRQNIESHFEKISAMQKQAVDKPQKRQKLTLKKPEDISVPKRTMDRKDKKVRLKSLYESVGVPNTLPSFVVGGPGTESRSVRGNYQEMSINDKNVPMAEMKDIAIRSTPPALRSSTQLEVNSEVNIETEVISIVSDLLHIEPNNLDCDMPFLELGVDSISAVEITQKINDRFHISTLKVTDLYDYPDISSLTEFIASLSIVAPEVAPDPRSRSKSKSRVKLEFADFTLHKKPTRSQVENDDNNIDDLLKNCKSMKISPEEAAKRFIDTSQRGTNQRGTKQRGSSNGAHIPRA